MSRAYGWTRDGLIVEDEAENLQYCAQHVLAGGSMKSLVGELNAAETPTVSGKPWSPQTIRRALTNPRIVGMRKSADGALSRLPGVEPILEVDVWERLVALFGDESRQKFTPRRSKAATLLGGGILRCGRDGRRMYLTGEALPQYTCSNRVPGGCVGVTINQDVVESEVIERVLSRITTDEWLDGLAAVARRPAKYFDDQLAEVDRRLRVLAETFSADGDDAVLEAGVRSARREQERLQLQAAQAAAAPLFPELTDEAVVEWWVERADLSARRQVIEVVVDHVVVAPAEAGLSPKDRVTIVWR